MDEDEAALLAELRAISAKSSSRFESEEIPQAPSPAKPSESSSRSLTPVERLAKRDVRATPPWKRKQRPPVSPSPELKILSTPAPPEEKEDELLKELPAKKGGEESTTPRRPSWRDRKQYIEHDVVPEVVESTESEDTARRIRSSPSGKGRLPLARTMSPVESAPSLKTESKFVGERGGDANDAELLALLRGVSSKANDRFAGDDNDANNNNHDEVIVVDKEETPAKPSPRTAKKSFGVPPWKRNRQPVPKNNDDVVVVSKPKNQSEAPNANQYGIKSETKSNFVGERGGDANDAELLALLRGVSNKASDRFSGDDDDAGGSNHVEEPTEEDPVKPSPKTTKKSFSVPPWKRNRQPVPKNDDVVVVSKPKNQSEAPNANQYGIKSETKSNFVGERGGDANDAELLALLRGVSNKASDRFSGDDDDAGGSNHVEEPTEEDPVKPSPKTTKKSFSVPPWKRNRQPVPKNDDVVVVSKPTDESNEGVTPAPAPDVGQFGIKTETKSNFVGERGGDANDAELLALLRGVSQQSSDRFADGDSAPASDSVMRSPISRASPKPNGRKSAVEIPPWKRGKSSADLSGSDEPVEKLVSTAGDSNPELGDMSSSLPPGVSAKVDSSDEVTREGLAGSIKNKNWKIRSQSYELLSTVLQELAGEKQATGDIESDRVLAGLDSIVPEIVQDVNASALDKGLEFAMLYAEHCVGGSDPEQAARIVKGLVKKNALSSRPTTLKLASMLTLKLMEVGRDGAGSIHSIVEVLVTDGLSSRKPKVLQASSALIYDAACEFGAAHLPLASISSQASKMLSHSNVKVRESGIKIIAEICRALGSKDPLQSVLDGMKKAQLSELDSLLANQPNPVEPKRRLRSVEEGGAPSAGDALASLQEGAVELEAQRYAARKPVNLMAALPKTEFATKLKLAKWSEKVGALDIALGCGGEKPYKLVPPSSSANYSPLISDMKKLLSHTHFAVCSKAMQVLSMLAEGVGERLYPHLRPLLSDLLLLSKDKKLTRQVSSTLDTLFGNILSFDHLLDDDDALPEALNETKQKNALARVTALEFLARCVNRRENAGDRGVLVARNAKRAADLCTRKLDDSDASVRKAALSVFTSLQSIDHEDITGVVSGAVEALKSSHPRVYKTLGKGDSDATKPSKSRRNDMAVKKENQHAEAESVAPVVAPQSSALPKVEAGSEGEPHSGGGPTLQSALDRVNSLNISSWSATEDDDGVLAGLQASKWLLKQDAIKTITAFIEGGGIDCEEGSIEPFTSAVLVVVREHTRGFKETNVNIMKAIVQLFTAVCEFHEATECPLPQWGMIHGADVAASKIADKKLSSGCKTMLSAICTVSPPNDVILAVSKSLANIRAPTAHEESLKWMQQFCVEFGAATLGSGVTELLPWLLEEANHSNPKVKREALNTMGTLHMHLGSTFQGLSLSLAKSQDTKSQLERSFGSKPFDPSLQGADWPRQTLGVGAGSNVGAAGPIKLDVPTTNLFSNLSEDILADMASKEGKAAWKKRKSALDEVEGGLKACVGLIEANGPSSKQLVELCRLLRDRLSDTQINLKPVAARVCGLLISKVDLQMQARLGKILFAPLILAAMNDIKKPMRDASLTAIKSGITTGSPDDNEVNTASLEALVSALVGEVTEKTVRAGGLPEVLLLLLSVVENLPCLDEIISSRGQPLGEKYAAVIVECLTSSKSETRSAASKLLEKSLENGVISADSIRKNTERLKPAKQRSVAPIVAKYTKTTNTSTVGSKKKGDSKPSALSTAPALPPPTQRISSSEPTKKIAETLGDHHSHHPLISKNGKHTTRLTLRSEIWPEYPEECHGSALLSSLQKSWGSMLPSSSVLVLFPKSGIRKQDDAQKGCELISRAVSADRTSGMDAVTTQLELVLKWFAYVLCSKEATVGLQSLLESISDVFSLLVDSSRELSDTEALLLAPFLIEKAGASKGRFRDKLFDIVDMLKDPRLVPVKRFGSIVCVSVMERSIHAKARLLAYQYCLEVVEEAGLVGIGKRGVTTTAKMLSDEKTPPNKAAAMELMLAVLSRMNGGDIQRLAKICGASLSEKSRLELEQKWAHRDLTSNNSRATPSQRPSPRQTPKRSSEQEESASVDLFDQLPALTLRDSSSNVPPRSQNGQSGLDNKSQAAGPFAFSLSQGIDSSIEYQPVAFSIPDETTEKNDPDSVGAAASLRARLLKIRERSSARDHENDLSDEDLLSSAIVSEVNLQPEYNRIIATVIRVVATEHPLHESDENLEECINDLKKLHAALSRQQTPTVNLSAAQLDGLRLVIKESINGTVEHLTSVIGFAFSCGEPDINSGMSIPLLSVCLATLMALFRDSSLCVRVAQNPLESLLRETGTALLDPRLGASSDLDSTTSSQMVRAINKLALQAASGATRHVALQSLMSLQQQLSVADDNREYDATFNSRLSRVVTKLFSRVLKTEENESNAFSADTFDMESTLCSAEEVLTKCNDADRRGGQHDSIEACRSMVKSLMTSILKSQGSSRSIRLQMTNVEIPVDGSVLGTVLTELEADLFTVNSDDLLASINEPSQAAQTLDEPLDLLRINNDDIVALVSALGSAPLGPERDSALEALKNYTGRHGNTSLNAHLEQVSPAFRAYVEEQLSRSTEISKRPAETGSVSERLRDLRSRLQAAELSVHASVDTSGGDYSRNEGKKISPRASGLAQPSPSKLSSGASSSKTLRERLAATRRQQTANVAPPIESSGTTSRAAALRARLEAVKNKQQQHS